MGKPSAYQRQATGRAARATKALVVADTKVRAAARVLADALAAADKASAAVVVVNKTYGTAYPDSTRYVQALRETGLPDGLAKVAESGFPTEHQAIIGTFADSKDGAELPGVAALGEYVAPVVEAKQPGKKPRPEKAAEAEPMGQA